MTIAVVDSSKTLFTTATTAFTVSAPSTLIAGQFLWVEIAWNGSSGTITPPSGWTQGLAPTFSGSAAIACYWHVVTAGEQSSPPASWTFTMSASVAGNLLLGRFSGVNGTTPIDAGPGTLTGSGTTRNAPSITTTTANAFVLGGGVLQSASSSTITEPAGWTALQNSSGNGAGRGAVLATKGTQVSAGATGVAAFTLSTALGSVVYQVALAAASDVAVSVDLALGLTAAADRGVSAAQAVGLTFGVACAADVAGPASNVVVTETFGLAATAVRGAVGAVAIAETFAITAAATVATVDIRWLGQPSRTSISASAKTTGATSVRMAVSTSAGMTSPTYSTAVAPSAAGWSKHAVTGLSAGTTYYYAFDLDGFLGTVKQTSTLPAGDSFTMAFASCLQNNAAGGGVFEQIIAQAPDFFHQTGDFHYGDIVTNSITAYRSAMVGQFTSSSGLRSLAEQIPMLYSPSDHDSGNNDWSPGPGTQTPAFLSVYGELVPHPTLPNASGVYYTYVVGRVRFIAIDARSFRSANSATDDSSKTMLGATQKAWLKDRLSDPEPLKVIVSDVPWIETTTAGSDKWGGFTTERQEIADYINNNGIRAIILHGDAHSLCADNGTNSVGHIPVIGAAPLSQTTSIKGGPYSQGTYPASGNTGGTAHLFGLLTFTDVGTSITVSLVGLDEAGVTRMTLTVVEILDAAASISSTFGISASATVDHPADVTVGLGFATAVDAEGATSPLRPRPPLVAGAAAIARARALAGVIPGAILVRAGVAGSPNQVDAAIPITFGLAASATAGVTSAASVTETLALDVSAVRGATGAASVPLTFGISADATVGPVGSVAIGQTFALTSNATRGAVASVAVAETFGIAATATLAGTGASTIASTFGIAASATVPRIGDVAPITLAFSASISAFVTSGSITAARMTGGTAAGVRITSSAPTGARITGG